MKKNMKSVISMCMVSLLMAAVSYAGPEPRPDQANEVDRTIFTGWDRTLYVDAARGSDGQSGTQANPVKTIGKAIELADPMRASGKKVSIQVAGGVYRERFVVNGATAGDALQIVKNSNTSGSVIITGAANYSNGWISHSSGRYFRAWDKNFGYIAPPAPWVDKLRQEGQLNKQLARREGVWVNDSAYKQELSFNDMQPGSFWADETGNKLWIWPRNSSIDLTSLANHVEVAVTPPVEFKNTARIMLKNLTFERFSSAWSQGGLHFEDTRDVLVQGCDLMQGTASGMSVRSSTRFTVDDCNFLNNGTLGLSAAGTTDLVVKNSDFRWNADRGVWANYTGWFIGACKVGSESNRILVDNCLLQDNSTHGLWFDVQCTNMIARNCRMFDNGNPANSGKPTGYGLFIEVSYGPALIDTCKLNNNLEGVHIANAPNTFVFNCDMINNREANVVIHNETRDSSAAPTRVENVWFKSNHLISQGPGGLLIEATSGGAAGDAAKFSTTWSTSNFSNNQYECDFANCFKWHPDSSAVNFSTWKMKIGGDGSGSTFTAL